MPPALVSDTDRALGKITDAALESVRTGVNLPETQLQLLGLYERPPTWTVLAYYAPTAITLPAAEPNFLEAGGVILKIAPTTGLDAGRILSETPDSTRVMLASIPSAVVFGDETSPGVRPVGVYWSAAGLDWSIRAALGPHSASDLIAVARAVYCSAS